MLIEYSLDDGPSVPYCAGTLAGLRDSGIEGVKYGILCKGTRFELFTPNLKRK